MTALKSASFCFALLMMVSETATAANPYAGRTTPASRYFSRGHTVLPQRPARRPAPEPMAVSVNSKPFTNQYREPSLSPYLSLDLMNDESGLPSYYAFVQPQRQQQRAIEAQEAQIRRLQQQVRTAAAKGTINRNVNSGMPTTGSSSRFMNLGRYYPGLR